MDPVGKALWYVEAHLAGPVSLARIAVAVGVSRHHVTRAFATALGQPLMAYVRARRLSEAARQLAGGAPDILAVAVAAGYASHEAFTRAFRARFSMTPEALRRRRRLDGLPIKEPIMLNQEPLAGLALPRFERGVALTLAGLRQRLSADGGADIPALWQRFAPYLGQIPGQVGQHAYGVCVSAGGGGAIEYWAALAVAPGAELPRDFGRLRLAPQQYAVFDHPGHVATVRRSFAAIWRHWLPGSGHVAADAPCFERYGPEFDGETGQGGFEIWLPVERK